ncbi:MAG TPA: Mur ligase family protein [Planctomycetota bacterium]
MTGPNLLGDRAGAVADLGLADADAGAVIAAWRECVRRILAAVGWAEEPLWVRVFAGGASVGFAAPRDALYAATEVNEWAVAAAAARLDGTEEPSFDQAATHLRALIEAESNPALRTLERAAECRDVAFSSDDEHVSVGLGTGARCWPAGDLPAPEAVDWERIHDVPVALVTGTNGKTTTVRLLRAMIRAAGLVAGVSTTDWIGVGDEIVATGDWSGPGGARRVLRDPRVEMAVLETARGGMLRRGLAVQRAEVALITNIAEDHLGEFGVGDLQGLADAKFVVARVARHLVLNADDEVLRERALSPDLAVGWFGLDPAAPGLRERLAAGAEACVLDDGELVRHGAAGRETVLPVAEIPATLGGAARHNVANAAAAVAVASALGLSLDAVRAGLRSFANSAEENPGRLNEFELGGVRVLVDFAHNPHAMEPLMDLVAALPAQRRALILGQAGDRDDAAIRALAQVAVRAAPDRVFLKEMAEYQRGRIAGEVVQLLHEELCASGLPPQAVQRCDSELAAARAALSWAARGDLLLLLSHAQRPAVLALLTLLHNAGWQAGQPLPAADGRSGA